MTHTFHKIAPRIGKISEPFQSGKKAGWHTLRDSMPLFRIHAELYGPQPQRKVWAGVIGGALLIAIVPLMLVFGAVAWGFVYV